MTNDLALIVRRLVVALLVVAGSAATAHAATQTLQPDSAAAIRARYAGQPVIVHIWGMTCAPCVKELPQWGALLKTRPDLHLVLIQVDESPLAPAERRVKEAGLSAAESWTVAHEPDEFMRASIDPQWSGDMPRTLLVGADGKIVRIQGSADFGKVKRWLASQQSAR
jgi:thiol-disulfide isomerase/thioredoxin